MTGFFGRFRSAVMIMGTMTFALATLNAVARAQAPAEDPAKAAETKARIQAADAARNTQAAQNGQAVNVQAQPPVIGPQQPVRPAQPAIPQGTVELKPGEAPQIEFDTPVFDFGRIRSGIVVHHDFWFTNTGTGPLEIIRVQPSCGCTQAGPYDHIVQPGQSGRIPLQVNAGNASGPISKNITIFTNATGPASQSVLTIKGEMWQLVQLSTPSLYFGKIITSEANSASSTKTTVITVNNGAKATMGEIKSTNPAFKGEIKEIEPGVKYELAVSLVPPLKSGNNFGNMEVATGLPEMPKVTVACSAMVVAELEVNPPQVAVIPTNKVALKRPVIVNNYAPNTKMTISNLVCSNPKVGVTVKEITPGAVFQIMVDLPADYAKAGAEQDKIVFNTDKAGYETVTIPIVEQQVAMPMSPGMNAPVIKNPAAVTANNAGITATVAPVQPAVPPANPPAVDPHAGHGH